MVLLVLREYIKSAEIWSLLIFNLYFVTICTYLMNSDLLQPFTILRNYSYYKYETGIKNYSVISLAASCDFQENIYRDVSVL